MTSLAKNLRHNTLLTAFSAIELTVDLMQLPPAGRKLLEDQG
jgi:hypothetical protein